jgi:hypothetical protein
MFARPQAVRAASAAAPFSLALLILAGTLVAAMAAPNPEPRPPLAAPKQQQTQTVEMPAPDTGPTCAKPRRKLWVEGEGWVVRRVPVC